MPPSYWYYGLIIISMVLLKVSLANRKDFKLLVLSLITSGLIHPGEVFILLVWPAYRYLPQIHPNPGIDNVIGAYVSDLFTIPASVVLINAFSLSWVSVVGIAAIFTGTDVLFVRLGIYQHFWWKPLYTGVLLIFIFAISKWIWRKISQDSPSKLFRLAVIFICLTAIYMVVDFIAVNLLQLYRFHLGWLTDPLREHFLIISVYGYMICFVIALSFWMSLPLHYKILILAVLGALNWLLGYYQILIPLARFSPVYFTLIPIAAVIIQIGLFHIARMDRYI